jgi:hypothetical protein
LWVVSGEVDRVLYVSRRRSPIVTDIGGREFASFGKVSRRINCRELRHVEVDR